MNNRTYNILVSLIIAMSIIILLVLIQSIIPSQSWMHRLTCLLGGCLPNGLIQGFTYFLFAFGILELKRLKSQIENEDSVFAHDTEIDQIHALNQNAIIQYFRKLKRQSNFVLADMMISMSSFTTQGQSVMEAMEYHNNLKSLRERKEEGRQNLLRYVIWAIPSVGFIGTVIGIASSLGKAGKAGTTEGITEITGLLNIAFDTTLVALLLSIVLVYLFHSFQERAEEVYTKIDAYILEYVVRKV